LTEIELIGRPFDGYFQVDRYHIDGERLSLQRVRSLITETGAWRDSQGMMRSVSST
jgi:hypothetical protein